MKKLAALLAALSTSAAVQAALTPINARGAGNGAERCLTGVLCAGGADDRALSITRSFEIDLGLAAGTLQRVDDSADRRWSVLGGGGSVLPIARYAADDSRLGVTTGAGVSPLTDVLANGRVLVDDPQAFVGTRHFADYATRPFPWMPLGLSAGAQFAFVLDDLTSRVPLVSDTSIAGFGNSSLAQDWMVTWRVPGRDLYLVAWEDRATMGANGLPNDYDYNDYVFAVQGVQPVTIGPQGDPPPVPLPAPLPLMAAGLGLLAFALRLRGRGDPRRGARGPRAAGSAGPR
jgi:hypothetical protein